MKSNLSRDKSNRIIYSAMRWSAIPKIAFLKSKTMYSPFLGKAISGAVLCFPLLWPQSSFSLRFSGPCLLIPGQMLAATVCISGLLATAPTGNMTLLHPALGMLVLLHLAIPALGCPGKLCSCLFNVYFCWVDTSGWFLAYKALPKQSFLVLFRRFLFFYFEQFPEQHLFTSGQFRLIKNLHNCEISSVSYQNIFINKKCFCLDMPMCTILKSISTLHVRWIPFL